MTDDQRVLYDNVGEARNTDAALRWSIAQVFFLLHSALLTLLTTRFAEAMETRIILSLIGAVLGILWLMITDRTQDLLAYWNGRLRAFELEGRQTIPVFSGQEYQALQGRKVTTYRILLVVIFVLEFVWFGLFFHYISRLRIP